MASFGHMGERAIFDVCIIMGSRYALNTSKEVGFL